MEYRQRMTCTSGEVVDFTIDPNDKHTHLPAEAIIGSLGVLPIWALGKGYDEDWAGCFERQYDFWVGRTDSQKTHIADDGTYQYPEDPDLDPLLHIRGVNEEVYFYQYALVAIRNLHTDGVFVTRLD
jgi:hypothetical protein